jgi:uncharacterized membrane protein (DUF485 family)
MAGFDHVPPPRTETEDAAVSVRNGRYGLVLFFVYVALYGGFMLINAFAPAWMEITLGGINLAVIYGLGLIAAAFVLALIYAWLCSRPIPPAFRVEGENKDEGGRMKNESEGEHN